MNYGSAGPGSAPHLTIAMIAAEAGIQMVHVPFAGLAPSTNALVAGTVDVGLVIPVSGQTAHRCRQHPRAGDHRRDKRSRLLPDVPTLREVGVNGRAVICYGLWRRPRPTRRSSPAYEQTLSDMMRDQAFTDRLYALGFEVRPLIGDDYRDFIVKDLDKWRAVAKAEISRSRIEAYDKQPCAGAKRSRSALSQSGSPS